MATDFNLSYQATPTFQKVHRDPSSYIFVRGPVGSGKSSGCIWHLFLNAIHQEPNSRGVRTPHYAVIRSTYPELKSTTIKSWTQWFGPLLKMTYATPIKGRIEMPLSDGTQLDMELTFIALDREEEVSKLQSLELTGAHVNEAADIPLSVIQMLKSRIGRWPSRRNGGCTHKFIICDYNSVNTEHELYDLAENVRPDGYSFYTQPSALLLVDKGKGIVKDLDGNEYDINPEAENLATEDNPDAGVTADYYIDQVKGAASDWINVYLMNNYGMARHGKPVFYMYKDNIHCSEEPIKPLQGIPIIIAVDLGLTPAAVFAQLSPTGTMHVFDEIITEDCSIQEFCEDLLWPKLRNSYNNYKYCLYVDPAGTQRSANDKKSALDIIREQGLPVTTARTNEDLARREAVIYFLRKQNGFLLSPECTGLRKGFISDYHYPKVKNTALTKFKDEPEKNWASHVHDALQYAALELKGSRVDYRRPTKRTSTAGSRRVGDSVGGY